MLLCSTLCDPMDQSSPCSSVHGILQARILEWVAFPSPGDPPSPGIESVSHLSPELAGEFLPLTQRLPLKKSSLPTFHIQFQSEIFRNSVNLWCFHYIIYHSLPDSILFYFMPINLNFFLVWKEQADRAITMIHWTKALRAIVNLKGRKTRESTETNSNT